MSMTMFGDGETPPLFRLIILRSTVKAWRMLSQKSSSRATVSAGRPETTEPADWARAIESTWKAAKNAGGGGNETATMHRTR